MKGDIVDFFLLSMVAARRVSGKKPVKLTGDSLGFLIQVPVLIYDDNEEGIASYFN